MAGFSTSVRLLILCNKKLCDKTVFCIFSNKIDEINNLLEKFLTYFFRPLFLLFASYKRG